MIPMNTRQHNAISIIKNTEKWLKVKEPEIYADMRDVIRNIIDGIRFDDRDPDICVEDFEDWVEDLLRMK